MEDALRRLLPVIWAAVLAVGLSGAVAVVDVPPAIAAEAPLDTDADGLPDTFEADQTLTDPLVPDTDADGVPDAREDLDGDGLTNRWELRLGLHPRSGDSDRDGTSDGREDHDGDRLQNRFEIRITSTDPRSVDSDHDGLVDGVEDADRDDLSNAGEQRYGTDPAKADTDRDGVDDWHEDSDGDGRSDGMRQDRRRLPRGLQPGLGQVPQSGATERCHQNITGTKVLVCDRHTGDGKLVVVIGDSHAWHWREGLDRVARARDWRLLFITKSACPVADIELRYGYKSCPGWREAAFARIRSLAPALVIVSQLDGYRIARADGQADNTRLFRKGLVRSLRRLDRMVARVIVLGDVSRFGEDPVGCLRRHRADLSKCSIRRSVAANRQRFAAERAAARAAGVAYRDTWRLTCPYDPCPLVIDRVRVARDTGHITSAFARRVWRGLARRLPR
ncbi:MAG: SGNH hydrolase domain-containing protein [Candidatus Limnocylindrales bacterium]